MPRGNDLGVKEAVSRLKPWDEATERLRDL